MQSNHRAAFYLAGIFELQWLSFTTVDTAAVVLRLGAAVEFRTGDTSASVVLWWSLPGFTGTP